MYEGQFFDTLIMVFGLIAIFFVFGFSCMFDLTKWRLKRALSFLDDIELEETESCQT